MAKSAKRNKNLLKQLRVTLGGDTVYYVCLVIILIVGTGQCFGQRSGGAAQGGGIAPDRIRDQPPKQAPPVGGFILKAKEKCDPNTVKGTCPGTFAFTYGFNAGAAPRGGGASGQKGGFAFTTYVSRRVFLELDNDNFVSKKDSMGRTTGFGDTTAYIGADAILEDGRRPSVTLMYGVKAPTAKASSGIGTGQVDQTILGIVGKTFGKVRPTYVELDVGHVFAGKSNTSAVDNFPFAAFIVRQKLDKKRKYTLHMEVDRNFRASGYDGDAFSLNYLETKVSEFVLVRLGGRIGITDNVSKAGFYFGLKFIGNFLK